MLRGRSMKLRILLFAIILSANAFAVDASTLTGKVMCGYQGWFTTEGDGARLKWHHWTTNGKAPTAENIPDIDRKSVV